VDDQRRRGALLRGDLVLVRPPAVVGHRAPLEDRVVELLRILRVGHGRIVDEHHDRLPADVDALVVVPAVLGRDDAVPDEHDVGVLHVDGGLLATAEGDGVLRELEGDRLSPGGDRACGLRREADETACT
jgi:hypothetical protein